MRVQRPLVLLHLLVVPRPLLPGPGVLAGPDSLLASLLSLPLDLLPFIRPSLNRAKFEFKRQSCVFWVLFVHKNERKKLEFPEMDGSALPGTPLSPL